MQIETKDLKRAFAVAGPIARAARAPLPILGHVRLASDGGAVRLSACDLESEARAQVCDAEGSGEVDVCLPAERMADFIEHAGDSVRIDVAKDRCRLRSGDSRVTMAYLPGKDMPAIVPNGNPIEVALADLPERMNSVVFSTAKKDLRVALHGVCVQAREGKIACVAVSSFTMAVNETAYDGPDFEALLHADTVKRLARFEANAIKVYPKSAVSFCGTGDTITAKMLVADFPNWRAVLAEDKASAIVKVERDALIGALGMVAPFCMTKLGNGIAQVVSISARGGKLRVAGDTQEGDAESVIEAEGEFQEWHFDAGQLLPALERVRADKVELGFYDGRAKKLVIHDGHMSYVVTKVLR